MVKLAFTGLVGLLALLPSAAAAPQRQPGASSDATCIAEGKLFRSGRRYRMRGANYIVRCARDSSGDDVANEMVTRGGFAYCFEACERTRVCAAFTYVGNKRSGTCYLKARPGSYTPSTDDIVSCEHDPYGPDGEDPEPVPTYSTSQPVRTSSTITSAASSTQSASKTSRSDLNTFPETTSEAATPTPKPANECQEAVKTYGEVYKIPGGSSYQLQCGTDHYGGDLSATGGESFLGCIDVCEKKPDCIGYAYTPGNCYLKSYLTAKQVSGGVDFALNLDRNSTYVPPPAPTSSTSTVPTTKPTPAPGFCSFIAGNQSTVGSFVNANKIEYTFECGADHNGGDIGNAGSATFEGCTEICDKTDKCIAFAWVGGNGPGTCFLKGTVTGRETNGAVDFAYKKAATYLPPPSSSSTSKSSAVSSSTSVPVQTSSSSTSAAPTSTRDLTKSWTKTWSSVPSSSSSVVSSTYTPPPPPPTSTRSWTKSWTKTESSSSIVSTYTSPPPSTSSKSKSWSKTSTVEITKTLTSTNWYPTSTSSDYPTSATSTWKTKTKHHPHHTKSKTHHYDHHTKSKTHYDNYSKTNRHHQTRTKPHHDHDHHTKTKTHHDHHTKSKTHHDHHTKTKHHPHHTKSSTTPLPTESKSVYTYCSTTTLSADGSTSVSVVTQYTNEPYTHTEWASSTTSASSTSRL